MDLGATATIIPTVVVVDIPPMVPTADHPTVMLTVILVAKQKKTKLA